MEAIKSQLVKIEEFVARRVCGGGYITKAEADLLWELRLKVGKKYDAINGRWQPLDAE